LQTSGLGLALEGFIIVIGLIAIAAGVRVSDACIIHRQLLLRVRDTCLFSPESIISTSGGDMI
jgi:hypothetical protein